MIEGKDSKITVCGKEIESDTLAPWGFGEELSPISFTGSFQTWDKTPEAFFNIDQQSSLPKIELHAPPRKYVLRDSCFESRIDAPEGFRVDFMSSDCLIKYPIEYQYKNAVCKFFERIGGLI